MILQKLYWRKPKVYSCRTTLNVQLEDEQKHCEFTSYWTPQQTLIVSLRCMTLIRTLIKLYSSFRNHKYKKSLMSAWHKLNVNFSSSKLMIVIDDYSFWCNLDLHSLFYKCHAIFQFNLFYQFHSTVNINENKARVITQIISRYTSEYYGNLNYNYQMQKMLDKAGVEYTPQVRTNRAWDGPGEFTWA